MKINKIFKMHTIGLLAVDQIYALLHLHYYKTPFEASSTLWDKINWGMVT